jgi:hypothetical protein
VNGIPSGPANAQGLNNGGNDPSGAGNAAKVASPSGNNGLGTASSSGNAAAGNNSNAGGTGSNGTAAPAAASTVGSSGVRSNGAQTPGGVGGGPTVTDQRPVDATIDAENRHVDAKVKSICKGC